MELRQLRYFRKVAETLHFGQAAKQLHISQQPLSFQIKQLEDELGVRLFERTTRSVALTPAGRVLLADVQGALGRIERGVETAQRVARGEGRKLNFGYNGAALYSVMPLIVRRFRERFPQVEVALREFDSPILEQQILGEDLDIGIAVFPGERVLGLTYETIYQEPAVVALPRSHALAARSAIALRDLAAEQFVMYARSAKRQAFDQCIALCHMARFSPLIVQEAATESALIGLVAAGLGVALVPSSLSGVRPDAVAYRRLVKPTVTVEGALAWKDDSQLPWLHELRRIAQEVMPRLEPRSKARRSPRRTARPGRRQ